MKQSLTIEQKQSALKKIIKRLEPVGSYGTQLIMYATALGAIATIGGADIASAPLNILIGSVGFNLLSNIIERVALGENIPGAALQKEVEVAIQKSGIDKLLTKDDFYRAIAKIVRSQDQILSSSKANDIDLRRLSDDIQRLINILGKDSQARVSTSKIYSETMPSYRIWNELPDLSGFKGRNSILAHLESGIYDTKRVIVYGISGTGKTLTIAKLAENLKVAGVNICWIGLNAYLGINDIQSIISRFLLDVGFRDFHNKIQSSEPATIQQNLIEALLDIPIYLFFDSLNSTNQVTQKFIEDLFAASVSRNIQGGILISSTSMPDCYSRVDVLNGKITETGLAGFTFDETLEFFKDSHILLSQDNLYEFHEAVGGHPMSISFLYQLTQNSSISSTDVEELKKLGIEASRDWLFNKVFNALNEEEKKIIHTLSIFDYPFEDKEVEILITSTIRPQFALMTLIKRHFIYLVGDKYILHDAVRTLSYNMMASAKREELHRTMANHIYKAMESQLRVEKEVEVELGYQWSYHLERLTNFTEKEQMIKKLLTIDDNHLSALLAIAKYGYPFDFEDESLETSKDVCKSLLSMGLIKRNYLRVSKPNLRPPHKKTYNTNGIEFFDFFFLECLCHRRGIANFLGYFDMPKENFAFFKQGLLCQWEHCIELYPLLPEANETSCPVFGHCCPGGESQVAICAEIFKDFFKN